MNNIMKVLFIFIILPMLHACISVNVNLTPESQPLQEQTISGKGKDKVVLIDITGMISTEEGGTILGTGRERGMVSVVREQLDRARGDKQVKAVVFRINSPGGGVTASDMIYHEIKKYKEDTGAKVLAHFTETGASGAYYLALAADMITAQPTTITGSLGVTMLRVDATGLMEKIGISALHISSGPEKSIGSPFRPVTAEEKKIFQGVINDLYGVFVQLIVDERNMPPEKVRHLADGRIYTSREAKDAGLIDAVCYLDDAVNMAKKLANLDEAVTVTYLRPGEYRPNIYAMNMNLFNLSLGDLGRPGTKFTYLWMP